VAGAADTVRPLAGLRVVLLGPPGSGKGTQAEILSARLGVPAISTGEMLRQAVAAGTLLGSRVAGVMAAGRLVDDALMAEVVRERLGRPDARRGFLLDGYPRNPAQAGTLAEILRGWDAELDAVVSLQVPESTLLRRAAGRGREDDREEVVSERLRVYREQTEPLIEFYRRRGLLREVDGDRPLAAVTADIQAVLAIRV
jgi:adenylate kinase